MSFLYNIASYNGNIIWDALDKIEDGKDFIIKQHNNLMIIKYVKKKLYQQNYETLGLWRSVILDKKKRKIVSFSPPKSIPWESFSHQNEFKNCVITEFEEGTMCNLFFDEENQIWRVIVPLKTQWF